MKPRIRCVKPELFLHEGLHDLEKETGLPVRLCYIGLLCMSDRDGRFQYRPRSLKTQILPFDEVDFVRVLNALTTRGFIRKYVCNGEAYGWIPTFSKHQVINNRESASTLPDPNSNDCQFETSTRDGRESDALTTRDTRETHAGQGEQNGTEQNGTELFSLAPDASKSNPPQPPILIFETVGKGPKLWDLQQHLVDEFVKAYPGVDVISDGTA